MMARKQTTKKRKKASPSSSAGSQADQAAARMANGLGGTETVPYPAVEDNPEFRDFVRREKQRASTGKEAEPGRPPGRPPGTGKHQKAAAALNEFQAAGMDESVMMAVWRGVFEAAALVLKRKELKIGDTEARALARPSCVLWGYYMPMQLSPVHAAWTQLSLAFFGILGCRAEPIREGLRDLQAKTKEPPLEPPDVLRGSGRPGAQKEGDLPQAEAHFKPK